MQNENPADRADRIALSNAIIRDLAQNSVYTYPAPGSSLVYHATLFEAERGDYRSRELAVSSAILELQAAIARDAAVQAYHRR